MAVDEVELREYLVLNMSILSPVILTCIPAWAIRSFFGPHILTSICPEVSEMVAILLLEFGVSRSPLTWKSL